MKIDREFLYKLETCETRAGLENIIKDCDDDEIMNVLQEQYKQILEFNKDERIDSIKNILIYRYREYCKNSS